THHGQPCVKLLVWRLILCIRLDGEATVANAHLERRTRSGNIVTEAKLDRIIVQFKPRDGAGKPFDPDGLERGQRRILGEATGRLHRDPKPSERTSRTPGGRRNSARSIRMMTSEPWRTI